MAQAGLIAAPAVRQVRLHRATQALPGLLMQKHFELRANSVTILSFWGRAKSPALFLRPAKARNTSAFTKADSCPH